MAENEIRARPGADQHEAEQEREQRRLPRASLRRRARAPSRPGGRHDHCAVGVGPAELVQARVQLAHELGHRREPLARVLRHCPLQRRVKPQRDVEAHLRDRRHGVVDVPHRDGEEAVARVRRLAGEQLVDDDSERVNVAERIHRLARRCSGAM